MLRLKVVSLLFCLSVVTGCARVGGQPAQYTFNEPALVSTSSVVSQTVVPVGDTVTAIDVITLEIDNTVDPEGTLTLSVANSANDLLGRASVKGSEISTGWTSFHFVPPITVSGLTQLHFSWSGDTKLALGINTTPSNADPLNHPVHNPYAQGTASLNGKTLPGDLAFRVQGEPTIGAAINQLRVTVTTWLSKLFGFLPFATVWFFGIGVSVFLIVAGFKRS